MVQVEHDVVLADVRRALAEDIGSGDISAALVPADAHAVAQVISREAATLCGVPWFNTVFAELDATIEVVWESSEGAQVDPGQLLCTVSGPAQAILSGERTALNFLQTLTGTATITRRYVNAVAGTDARILDTRKTLPGLRRAQKYAVACGGGCNHRIGLYDGVLIKENHIEVIGSITAAVKEARQCIPAGIRLEVEVEDMEQVREALEAGADILLLDNMGPELLRECVAINAGRAMLEASGGITLTNIRAIAETGIDYISIGALTKHVQAVDLSMRFI